MPWYHDIAAALVLQPHLHVTAKKITPDQMARQQAKKSESTKNESEHARERENEREREKETAAEKERERAETARAHARETAHARAREREKERQPQRDTLLAILVKVLEKYTESCVRGNVFEGGRESWGRAEGCIPMEDLSGPNTLCVRPTSMDKAGGGVTVELPMFVSAVLVVGGFRSMDWNATMISCLHFSQQRLAELSSASAAVKSSFILYPSHTLHLRVPM